MFSQVFLAITEQEMQHFLPPRTAYMACHFSASGRGLSNLPQRLPEGSILILDDSMPVQGHDPAAVTEQLSKLVNCFSVKALLLDFQRPVTGEMENMVQSVLQSCPCPVAVPPLYAKKCSCPVFLPPPPANIPLPGYIKPWMQHGVFLEIAPGALEITVTQQGSCTTILPSTPNLLLTDNRLHCHYSIKMQSDKVVFTLCRTKEDLAGLAQEAYGLGALGVVGLYQELQQLK